MSSKEINEILARLRVLEIALETTQGLIFSERKRIDHLEGAKT